MFEVIFSFDMNTKFSFNFQLLFKLFFDWAVNCASLVCKLYIVFQTQSDTELFFIVFMSQLFLLVCI